MPLFQNRVFALALLACWAVLLSAPVQAETAKIRIGEVEVSADCALARKEHPRLLFTKADLPGIRARIAKPALKPIYDALKQVVDGQMEKGAEYMSKQAPSRFVVPAGLLYHITGEEKYGQVSRAATMRAPFDVYATQGGYGYDLVYDLMTPEERAACETKMLVQARKGNVHSTNPTPLINALGIWGNGTNDAEMAGIISQVYQALLRRKVYLDEWAADRGGDGNSHDYIGQHEYVGTMGALQAWTAATGEDLFKDFNWARTMGAYHIYNILPDYRGTAHLGNDRYGAIFFPVETGATNFVSIAQAKWQDGVTGSWAKDVVCGSKVYYHVLERFWGVLLWYDPDVPEIAPSQIPQDMLFKTRGYLYARSDWERDATFVNFSCGRFEGDGRNNSDANAFMIYRKAYLACDSGLKDEYDPALAVPVPDRGHYWTETVAHNSITVGAANHPSKYDATLFGGQVGRVPKEWLSMYGLPVTDDNMITRQAGVIKTYETSPEFVYVTGDATNAYDPHVVDHFTRQFVYIRPGAIVVFDRVGAKNAEDVKRWYLHTMDKPQCLDGELTPDTAIHPEGHFLSSGKTLRAIRGGSALFSKTLLPAKSIVRVLGGPGHQFEVNGINHDLKPEFWKKMESAEGQATLERLGSGWWRVEVEPENKQANDIFLHVLWATDEGAKEMFPVKLIEQGDRVGVQFRADGSDVEVVFAKTGDIAGKIKITKGGKVVCDRFLATEVEDDYQKWSNDPRFKEWMTNPYMRSHIGEKDQDLFKKSTEKVRKPR
jgi:hypothetical protein